MAAHTSSAALENSTWAGGKLPFGASFGKLMMWFFLLSDAFTFSALLIGYAVLRFTHQAWPVPDAVFNSVPFLHGVNLPLVFVGIMTFVLIASSVTMVLAVDAGHRYDQKNVVRYLVLTIIGGLTFLGCQAWEWTHMIADQGVSLSGNPFFDANNPIYFRTDGSPTGAIQFGQLFFVITGFHGFHVASGVFILILVLVSTIEGKFQNRGNHYEMVEKIGLYWHFVDLVWVFVFTSFYLL
jgi:cytochrome c oxidase subunit III